MSKPERIRNHYEHRISTSRPTYDVVDWASEHSQQKRFEVLVTYVPLKGKSLLDVGCGMGDLSAFLRGRGLDVHYTGVDLLQKMVDACRGRFPGERFVQADLFAHDPFEPGEFDVVFCSGIFNLNLGNNVEFLTAALPTLFELSREFVVFNLLHARRPHRDSKYFSFDPADVLALVQPLACEVCVIDDYLPNDFTVICRKTRP